MHLTPKNSTIHEMTTFNMRHNYNNPPFPSFHQSAPKTNPYTINNT